MSIAYCNVFKMWKIQLLILHAEKYKTKQQQLHTADDNVLQKYVVAHRSRLLDWPPKVYIDIITTYSEI